MQQLNIIKSSPLQLLLFYCCCFERVGLEEQNAKERKRMMKVHGLTISLSPLALRGLSPKVSVKTHRGHRAPGSGWEAMLSILVVALLSLHFIEIFRSSVQALFHYFRLKDHTARRKAY